MSRDILADLLRFRCTFASQIKAHIQIERKQALRNLALFLFSVCVLNAFGPLSVAQTTTVVTFDDPTPPGLPYRLLNGVFQGIHFGTDQWRWSGPYYPNLTNHIYFDSPFGTFRTFSFAPGPRVLNSMNVYATIDGTLTLSDNVGQTVTRYISSGSMQLVTTGWSVASTTVTVDFTFGLELGIDDISHSGPGVVDTTPPNISIASPVSGSTVFGTVTVAALASDNVGVTGVRFMADEGTIGEEDTTEPYGVSWNTIGIPNGLHTLTSVARDAAGNQTTSTPVVVMVANTSSAGFSLRFYGNGSNDIDRVKIQIDDTTTSNPGPPADVGADDFTLEFWMRAGGSENRAPALQCGSNNNWIYGNIVFDRDRYNQDRSFGLSIAGGRFAFGVSGDRTGDRTICGGTSVLDGQWHHVAIQRRRADGWMWIYVDGSLDGQGNGPAGDISYPDDGIPGNYCGGPCTNSDPYLVFGAEKHDAGPRYPSYSGWIDEVRLSNTLRYPTTFTRPAQPFMVDMNTVALYHFDEGQGNVITDSSGAPGGPSHGVRRFGGSPPGPLWMPDTPFGNVLPPDTSPPSVVITSPAPGSTLSGTFTVSADASDNVGVLGVQFRVDDANAGAEDVSAPYAVALNTTTLTNGVHSLRAVARDAAGNQAASTPVAVTIFNSVSPPVTTTISPSTATVGGAGFTLTVNGTNFVTNSVVRWNGLDRATTFVSSTQLTAAVPAVDIAVAGISQVAVFNPGGGLSNAQVFTILSGANPAPAISGINPDSALAGGGAFTLTVNGAAFVPNSIVRWNGSDRITMFVSSNQLTATILDADITAARMVQVTVFNPAAGGGTTSTPQTFTIYNAQSGLVAAYSFNAGSGRVVEDSSGNSNNGAITGASWTAPGRFGGALSFDGDRDWVTVNDANSLDLTTGMTLEAWVYPTIAPSAWRTVIAKEQPAALVYFLHASSIGGNRPATGVYIGGEQDLFGDNQLIANAWTHLAGTYDGVTQRLFINGVQVASRPQTGAIQTSAGPVVIGGNEVWGEFFQGLIDEVRIYNRALSQAEIQNDMTTPLGR
jgi:Concanavalin A-like lectin/glucanases superfamily/Bacterial Ig domain